MKHCNVSKRIIDSLSHTWPGSLDYKSNDSAGGRGNFYKVTGMMMTIPTPRDNAWQYVTTFLPSDNAARDMRCRLWRGRVPSVTRHNVTQPGCRHNQRRGRRLEKQILPFLTTAPATDTTETIFGFDGSSKFHTGSMSVCMCDCPAQSCLEHSIFFFLSQRTIREQSDCVVPSEPKILLLVYFCQLVLKSSQGNH